MYCSGCGSPITPGLSFCNRCGTSLRDRNDSKQRGAIPALVTAMTLVALAGMGILLGGALALKTEAQFDTDVVVLFMFLTFFIVAATEILLYRQLGRLTEKRQVFVAPPQSEALTEFRSPQLPRLVEAIPSVTENTTRTLEYSREERFR